MIAAKDILAYVDAVADKFKPRRIVLFGSYAYGVPTEDSDIDLLVEMPLNCRPIEKATRIRLAVDAPFSLDLIVRTPADVRWRLAERDMFMELVVTKGITVYESVDNGVGRKGQR